MNFSRICGIGRREAAANLALLSVALPSSFSLAIAADSQTLTASEELRVFADEVNKFKISIPQDWQTGTGDSNGFNSLTAFYPQYTPSSNVSVMISGVGPDFTRMESFGKVDEFAETLIGGLDRSWQRPPGVAAKLVDCKSSKGIYYIEYTLQNPGEAKRHLVSAIGMASNGWVNRLYTVTGQFMDEDEEKFGSKVREAVLSFAFT